MLPQESSGYLRTSIIDFSASINPLGTPASVMSELRRHLKDLRHYPDPSAAELVDEIARSTGLDPRMILCGNGSTELIYLVARALRPERVLIPAPAFAEYERACIAASHFNGSHSKTEKLNIIISRQNTSFALMRMPLSTR